MLLEFAQLVRDFDMSQPPPALAGELYAMIRRLSGVDDLFAADKQYDNLRVLELLPGLRELVRSSADPLATALEISVIGNYLDVGVAEKFDWQGELGRLGESLEHVEIERFRADVTKDRARVLLLGDNAGEIGLDTLLVQELLRLGASVTYAVRGRAILNDALLTDARQVGMDQLCQVVSSGVDTPGTVLSHCSEDFLRAMHSADVLLSKGQGNYEALTGSWDDVYFAFKVKCPVISDCTELPVGTSVFRFESCRSD